MTAAVLKKAGLNFTSCTQLREHPSLKPPAVVAILAELKKTVLAKKDRRVSAKARFVKASLAEM